MIYTIEELRKRLFDDTRLSYLECLVLLDEVELQRDRIAELEKALGEK